MSSRGTGRTTRQLQAAAKAAADGKSVLYVCAHMREADHAMHILCTMVCPEELSRMHMQVPVGRGAVRFASAQSDPHNYLGWHGSVEFDHNSSPDPKAPNGEWRRWRRWNEFADFVNARQRTDTTN